MSQAVQPADTPMADASKAATAAPAAAKHNEVPRPNYTLQQILQGHADSVVSVKWSPDGSRLASASADKTAKIWDPFACVCLLTLEGHTKGLSDCAWEASSGKYVCTASDDLTLKLWDASNGACLRTLEGHTNYVFCCAFNPVMNHVVSGSFDETVRVWDTRDGRCLRMIPAHSDPVTGVDVSGDGTLIASSSYDGICRIWNAHNGACLKTLIDSDHPALSFVKFSPNGRFVLTAALDGRLKLWDYEHSKTVKIYSGHENRKHCVFAAFMVTDARARYIVAGSEDGCICLWDLQTKQMVQRIEGRPDASAPGQGHCDAVLAVACHPKQAIIATGALKRDPTIRLWADASHDRVFAGLFLHPKPDPAPVPARTTHVASGAAAADVVMVPA